LACTDLNGDGIADLIIGVPQGDAPGDHRIHAGVVYVIFGRQTLTGIIDLSKQADITILGADEGDLTGFSLATGDINGDHLSDLIIGAPGGDGYREKTPDAGETYLIYGRSRFPKSIDLAKNWNSRIFGVESRSSVDLFGENEPDNSGYAVAASDLNHDGLQDIIIGAPFADGFLNKETDAGESYVIFGKTKLPKNIRLSNQANITLYGSRRRDHSGQSLIRGDVNGDKIDDVIISSPGAVRKPKSGAFKGLLHAIFGKSDHPKKYHLRKNASMVFKSSSRHRCEEQALSSADEATMVFGRSLIALDLDQDGRDDLVAGDPCARGRMGKSQSGEIGFYLAREKQRLTRPTAVFQPEKTKSNEYFGFSLSRGDVNGDGRMDIIAGAPGMPRRKGLSTSGGAYVILGLSPK
jgi:hypothetical protein